jgi:hypothetical protein
MELSLAEPQPHRRSQPRAPAPSDDRGFGWRVVETTAIVVGVLLLASLLWFAADVLLLLFGAVLLATLLRAATMSGRCSATTSRRRPTAMPRHRRPRQRPTERAPRPDGRASRARSPVITKRSERGARGSDRLGWRPQ